MTADFAAGTLAADGSYLRSRSYGGDLPPGRGRGMACLCDAGGEQQQFSGTFSTTGVDSWQGTLEGASSVRRPRMWGR
jgi:hypothetical protein